ncbi:MAG: amidohydrolase family protein [Acidobacteria bacterium]|nr:amidohydrolase family protein [Acidobacteriota bacterium]
MHQLKSGLGVFLSLLFCSFLLSARAPAAPLEADWVLYNGKILTADTEDPARFTIAAAVAIYDGKFVVVGTTQQALETAGPNTRRIDLAGKTVLPGLIETHLHVHTQTLGHHAPGTPPLGNTDRALPWTSKDEGLAQLRTLALQKQPGEWIVAGMRGIEFRTPKERPATAPTLAELDLAAPNNPVMLTLGGNDPALVNSRALDALYQRYPQGVAGIEKDSSGKPTGFIETVASRTMQEFWPPLSRKELERVAPFFKKELEEPAARGLTAVATRLDWNSLRVYQLLDARNEMPVRLSVAHQLASYHPLADMILRRAPGMPGEGSPWLWLGGATAGTIEHGSGPGPADACIHGEYSSKGVDLFPGWKDPAWGAHGDCRLSKGAEGEILRNFFLAAVRNGWAVTNIHINGDRGLDEYLNLLEEADKQYGGVADLRFSADHCGYVTEQQAEKAKRLGISFTCTPGSLENADQSTVGAYTLIYDKERAADSYAPFNRLVRLGMKPSAHCEGHRDWTFTCLELIIARKDQKTRQVWGPQQRIDRREALYTFTRWAAWHLWKENHIGSIEKGKWADLVVIDRDYLTQPEDDISEINPLLTIVGGKIAYSEPTYASGVGLPAVGFQAPADWWGR